MADNPRWTRNANHLYPINPDESRRMHAGVAENKQVLMGLYCPCLVAMFFDRAGNLLETQQRTLQFMVEDIERGLGTDIYDIRINRLLEDWKDELGLTPTTIRVKRFFALKEPGSSDEQTRSMSGIGIVDYPFHFAEVLDNPAYPDEDMRRSVQETLVTWEENEQFVLWWGNDYWLDKTGECVAS